MRKKEKNNIWKVDQKVVDQKWIKRPKKEGKNNENGPKRGQENQV